MSQNIDAGLFIEKMSYAKHFKVKITIVIVVFRFKVHLKKVLLLYYGTMGHYTHNLGQNIKNNLTGNTLKCEENLQ